MAGHSGQACGLGAADEFAAFHWDQFLERYYSVDYVIAENGDEVFFDCFLGECASGLAGESSKLGPPALGIWLAAFSEDLINPFFLESKAVGPNDGEY